MKALKFLVIFCFFSSLFLTGAHASTDPSPPLTPMSVKIANDHQAKIELSRVNINRLFVAGDKITRLDAPQSRLSAQNDPSGSLYLTVGEEAPFTAFITTQAGRHFSLFIVPKSMPGVTVRLEPTTPVAFKAPPVPQASAPFEKPIPYETTLVRLLTQVMGEHRIAGFSAVPPAALQKIREFQVAPAFRNQPALPQAVVAGYLGGDCAVRVIKVTNRSRRSVLLFASDFYYPGVRAIALSTERLPPQASAFVFEVVNHV